MKLRWKSRETLHKGGPGTRVMYARSGEESCQPAATEVDLMNFWMRAAPISKTAIGHTSRS